MGFFSKGPKNEFETAVVNEPSGFEPLKFYCTDNSSKSETATVGLLKNIYRVTKVKKSKKNNWTIFFGST